MAESKETEKKDDSITFNLPDVKAFNAALKNAKDECGKLKKAGKGAADLISKGLQSSVKEVGNLAGGAKKAVSTILSASGISIGMDSVVNSMKTGFSNLEQSSEEYGASIKTLKDAQEELGGSLAEALAPAIQTLAPILAELIGYVNSAVETFGPFFAEFIGDNAGSLIQFKDNMVKMVSEINWASLLESLKGLWETLQPFAEAIGTGLADLWNNVLVPLASWVIGEGLPALLEVISGIVNNETAMAILEGIAIAIGSIAAAILIYNGVMTVASAVTGAFSAVMAFLTSPIGIIVLAIGALIAVGVLLAKNWQTVCDHISAVWNTIIGVITIAIEGIKSIIAGGIALVQTIITVALGVIQTVWDNILGNLSGTTKTVFEGIWNVIKSVINGIIGGIEAMANGIVNGVNTVIRVLNSLHFDIPDWIPGLGGRTFGFSIKEMHQVTFPRLATGGIATRPVTALIGEAGREAVLPLENNTGWMDALAEKLAARMSFGSSGPVYLQVDGQTFARLEMPYIKAENGRVGLNFGTL